MITISDNIVDQRLASANQKFLADLNETYSQRGDSAVRAVARFDRCHRQIQMSHTWITDNIEDSPIAQDLCINYLLVAPDILSLRHPIDDYIELLEHGLRYVRLYHRENDEAEILCDLGHSYRRKRKYDESLKCFEWARDISQKNQLLKTLARAFNGLGLAYIRKEEFKEAASNLEQGVILCRQLGLRRGEAKNLSSLGVSKANAGDLVGAMECFKEAALISRELHDFEEIGNCVGNLGTAFFYLGKYPEAINHHKEALQAHQMIHDLQGESNDLGNLADVYRSVKDYENALLCYNQALEIQHSISDEYSIAVTLKNLASLWLACDEFDKALEYAQEARQKSAINPQINLIAFGTIGQVYSKQCRYQEALDILLEVSKSLKEEVKDIYNATELSIDIAEVYCNLGNYEAAIDILQDALPYWRKMDNKENEARTLEGLGVAYLGMGNQTIAIQYLENARQIYLANAAQYAKEIQKIDNLLK